MLDDLQNYSLKQVYYMLNQNNIWNTRRDADIYIMVLVFLIIGEILAGIVYKIDSHFGLEFKYEFEFIRSIFTVSLFRIFYIINPSIQQGVLIMLVKIMYKILMYYVYPINYETIKNGLKKYLMRCLFKEKTAQFKEM